MNPIADALHHHLDNARTWRRLLREDPCPADHLRLKSWQAERLAKTHADLLEDKRHAPAAHFFLDELYGTHDFTVRDDEVARIIPLMVKLLPESALTSLADALRMDALAEELDHAMVAALRANGEVDQLTPESYARAYRRCGRRADRELQLELTAHIGHSLDRLTRTPMLGTSLRLMKRPAEAAGFGDLHRFLQSGFNSFQHMKGADEFLNTIIERERKLMEDWLASD
jgi:hypothetical protein